MTQYTHIRNATGKLTIKNTTFLIDPFLAPKDTYPGFEGTFNYQQRMPMVDLPLSMDNLLSNVTAVVVTHTHLDHWDDTAINAIPKFPRHGRNVYESKSRAIIKRCDGRYF